MSDGKTDKLKGKVKSHLEKALNGNKLSDIKAVEGDPTLLPWVLE